MKIVTSLTNSEYTYCPLILMLVSEGCNIRIDRMYQSSLRIILNDYESLL